MENTQKTPYLHVKHKNTRKIGVKMVENTLFSYQQNIENSSEVGRVHLISVFRTPEPILNPLKVIYLFRSKVTKPNTCIEIVHLNMVSFMYHHPLREYRQKSRLERFTTLLGLILKF